MKNYYTVVEFAKVCGVSKSAIYKKLNNTLSDYVIIVKGKRCISKSYFDDFPEEQKQDLNGFSPKVNGNSPKVNENSPQVNDEINSFSPKVNENFNENSPKVNESISETLENNLISILRNQLEVKDKQIETLQTELKEQRLYYSRLLEQSNVLQLQAQTIIQDTDSKKKGFFSKLFKRNKE